MFEVSVLASGSSGNCFYVESEHGAILIDAGISCRQVQMRLQKLGKEIGQVKGIFVTHEHSDHVSGIGVLERKYKIPVYMSKGTLRNYYGKGANIQILKSDEEFDLDGMKILPFTKSHDAQEPVSYLIKSGSKKVSVITDIGYACNNVIGAIKESDILMLEANHDLEMLRTGPYPPHLKQRIGSDKGHISNYHAALAVLEHGNKNLKHILLSHLSLNNNTPQIALKTFNAILNEREDLKNLKIGLTYREKPTELIRIE